jgi:hypothetical protein
MRNFPSFALALMLAAPAVAAPTADQTSAPEAAGTTSPAPASTMPADPATSSPAPADTTNATPAPTTAPAKSVADVVAADWAKYDTANKGSLNKAQFGKWMAALRTSAGQPAPDAAWLKTAFAQTDTDKNAKISSAELTAFLSAAG